MRDYRARNADALRQKARERRERDRDAIREKKRAYYIANREQIRARQIANYWQNREARVQQTRDRHRTQPALYRAYAVAEEDWSQLSLDAREALVEHLHAFLTNPALACSYCGSTRDITFDHIIPRVRGGSHSPFNIVPACLSCNSGKHTRSLSEWLALI